MEAYRACRTRNGDSKPSNLEGCDDFQPPFFLPIPHARIRQDKYLQVRQSLLPIPIKTRIRVLTVVHGCFMDDFGKVGNLPRTWQAGRRLMSLLLALGIVISLGGCTRAFFASKPTKKFTTF